VSGAAFADLGVPVKCVDINQSRMRMLEEGKPPIYCQGK